MHVRTNIQGRAWVAALGLLGSVMLLAGAADPANLRRPAAAVTNAAPSVATIELDVPVIEPAASLKHGVSKAGRQHNSNCRYWKTVVAPVDPAKEPIPCKICGG